MLPVDWISANCDGLLSFGKTATYSTNMGNKVQDVSIKSWNRLVWLTGFEGISFPICLFAQVTTPARPIIIQHLLHIVSDCARVSCCEQLAVFQLVALF